MILIIGACASGKRTFAESLGYSRADMVDAQLPAKVVFNAQDLLPRQEGVVADAELVSQLSACEVVIANEVGSGVHPLDRGERDWREAVGRMTNKLAAEATHVVRMVCGIPTWLKGEPWN